MKIFRDTLYILLPSQRLYGFFMFIMILIAMLFETLSIAAVLPMISVLSMESIDQNNYYVLFLSNFFNELTLLNMVYATIFLLIAVFTIKVIYLTVFQWVLSKYIYNLRAVTSKRLFENYLNQSYDFHLERNSADLIKNCMEEVRVFVDNYLMQAFIFITEVTILFGISIFILFIIPIEFLIVASLFTFIFVIFYYLISAQTKKFGKLRMIHDTKRIQQLNQGLVGVKEVKIFGKENFFVNTYGFHAESGAGYERKIYFFQNTPKYTVEFIGIICICLLILFLSSKTNFQEIIPIIALIAAAAFRILPSLNRIMATLVSIRYSIPVISLLRKEFESMASKPMNSFNEIEISYENEINLKNINFSYSGREGLVLSDINLCISKGETIGIVGTSGSGKTTLIDIILGLLKPKNGEILIDGEVLTNSRIKSWQSKIGYVPQNVNLIDSSIKNNVALGIPENDIMDKNLHNSIDQAQLSNFAKSLEMGLDAQIGESGSKLSGGQRQRIGIARALYRNPDLLILDEATSSLDSVTENHFMDAVYALKGKKTIIIISHRASTLNRCDKVYKIENTKLLN